MTSTLTRLRDSRTFAVAVGLYLLSTAYLAAFASPTLFYFANVVLHIVAGIVLASIAAVRLARAWRGLALAIRVASVVLAIGIAFGLAIVFLGAAGPYRWLLPAHIGTTLVGGGALLALWSVTLLRHGTRETRVAAGITAAFVCLSALASLGAGVFGRADARQKYRIENPAVVPASMLQEGRGPSSPFFPSSADTNVRGIIPANFFMTSESCGRCHHGHLQGMEVVRPPLLVVQQPVVPEVDRVHAGRRRHDSRRNGAPAATTTPCSSTAASTGRSRSRSTRPRRRPGSAARRATRSRAWGARWGRGTSRSSIRRSTIWRPARTRSCASCTIA